LDQFRTGDHGVGNGCVDVVNIEQDTHRPIVRERAADQIEPPGAREVVRLRICFRTNTGPILYPG
jgi:hypothetical protein